MRTWSFELIAQLGPRPPTLQGFLVELAGRTIAGQRVDVATVVAAGSVPVAQLVVVDANGDADKLQDLVGIAEVVVQVFVKQPAEIAPAILFGCEAQKLLERGGIGGPFLEDPAVPVERLVEVFDLFFVDLRDSLGPGQPQLGILAELEAQAVDTDQILPGVAADVDRLQQIGRLHADFGIGKHFLQDLDGLGVVGLSRQHSGQVLQRPHSVSQLHTLDLGQAKTQIDGVARRDAKVEPAFEQVGQIVPTTKLRVQDIERRHGLGVISAGGPHALPGRDGILFAPKLGGEESSLASLGELGFRVLGQIRPPQHHLVELLDFLSLLVDIFQRRQRAVVVGPPLNDTVVVVGGERQIAKLDGVLGDRLLHAHAGSFRQDVGLDGAVKVDDLDDRVEAQHARQAFVGVEHPVQLRIAGGIANSCGPGLERSLLVAELVLLDGGEARPVDGPRVPVVGDGDEDAQNFRQARAVAGLSVDGLQRLGSGEAQADILRRQQALQLRHGRWIVRREAENLPPLVDGFRRAAERTLQESGDSA